jgi:SagB-type dehydrogenase family enzyme
VQKRLLQIQEHDAEISQFDEYVDVNISLNEALITRNSNRKMSGVPISKAEVGTLLKYVCGTRRRERAYGVKNVARRFVPTAGGLNSAELFLCANNVSGLSSGVYYFRADVEGLSEVDAADPHWMLRESGIPNWLVSSAAVFIIAARPEQLAWKYGTFSYRLMLMDAGVIIANLYLISASLGLAGCALGAVPEGPLHKVLLRHDDSIMPLALFGVGRPIVDRT